MEQKQDYVSLGQVEERDPKAHHTDPRGTLRYHSNGLTKLEWFSGMALCGGVPAEDAVATAKNLIKELEK